MGINGAALNPVGWRGARVPSPEDVGRGPGLGWLCGFFQGVSTQQEGRAGPCRGRGWLWGTLAGRFWAVRVTG